MENSPNKSTNPIKMENNRRKCRIVNISVNLVPCWDLIKTECGCKKDSELLAILLESYLVKTGRTLVQVNEYLQVNPSENDVIIGSTETLMVTEYNSCNTISDAVDDEKCNIEIDNPEAETVNLIQLSNIASVQEDIKPSDVDSGTLYNGNSEEVHEETTDNVDEEHTNNHDSDTDGTVDLDFTDKKTVKRKRKFKTANGESPAKRKKKERAKSEPKETKAKKPKTPKKKVEEKPTEPWISVKLEDHMDKFIIERVESFERKNRGNVVFEDMYSCLICGQFKTLSKEVFEDHVEQHINKALECSKCNYVSFSATDILKHKQQCFEEKKEGREYVCHLCGCKLVSKGDKVAHMGSVHDIAELPCKYCGELFTSKHLRKMHYRRIHTAESQFCPSCNVGLSNLTKEEYKKHVTACIPGHQCQICGKMFQRKQGLDHHVTYTHMKVRKFKCTICPYTATTPDKLKLHDLAHKRIHPYNCDQCTFSCVQSYQLKSHMRTHTGERPYKCDQCNYAAAWNVLLKEHKKAHVMDTAVLCTMCNVVFKNANVLSTHIKKEHPTGGNQPPPPPHLDNPIISNPAWQKL